MVTPRSMAQNEHRGQANVHLSPATLNQFS